MDYPNDKYDGRTFNLCGYLKLDFDKYFDGYELQKTANSFTGNY